jgi:hypothetical protein
MLLVIMVSSPKTPSRARGVFGGFARTGIIVGNPRQIGWYRVVVGNAR